MEISQTFRSCRAFYYDPKTDQSYSVDFSIRQDRACDVEHIWRQAKAEMWSRYKIAHVDCWTWV
jgi:hypothetical protein